MSFNNPRKLPQQGFTVVELMIATMVFSIILLGATFSMLQIGKQYYKGVNSVRTQTTARNIMDAVSTAIQFSGSTPISDVADVAGSPVPATATSGVVCFGNQRFSFQEGAIINNPPTAALGEQYHGLMQDTHSGACSPGQNLSIQNLLGRELLGPRMRLTKFEIIKEGTGYGIYVDVVYGARDLSPSGACQGGPGGQFCATSQLYTWVQRRL